MLLIKNVSVFDGEQLKKDKCVWVEKGKIKDITIEESSYHATQTLDGQGQILAPGFIDIQVNGAGGCAFNVTQTLETLETMARTHLQFGTTSFLPTLITSEPQVLKQALQAVQSAQAQPHLKGVLGIHLEGPFLNPEKKGIHNPSAMHAPRADEIDLICQAQCGIKLVTLAPEKGDEQSLHTLVQNGVVVFLGHSNATYAIAEHAFTQGVRGVTHLFNACSPFTSREPGVVGAALLNENAWCSIIADGVHVSFDSLKLALRVKNKKKFILISDSMELLGTSRTQFKLDERDIFLKDGKYVDAHGTLAGAHLSVHQALQNILKHKLASLTEALAMSSTNAAACLRVDHQLGRIMPGYVANLVLLNRDNHSLLRVIRYGDVQ